MIEITTWMNKFLQTLNDSFGDRVWFVGLQGSYGRGEGSFPPSTYAKNMHLLRLIELMTVTIDREEINRYVHKQDVIFTYLPHLKGQVFIGR